MSSYRHFISYMHLYTKGKKGAGCGFVKIEVRNNICTLWFQLKNIPISKHLSMFFLIPQNNTFSFVPIWCGDCPNGILKQRFTTDSLHLFNTKYSFRQCSGIILAKNDEILCAGCWDANVKIPTRISADISGTEHAVSTSASSSTSVSERSASTPASSSTPVSEHSASTPDSSSTSVSERSASAPDSSSTYVTERSASSGTSVSSSISDAKSRNEKSVPKQTFEDLWSKIQKKYPPLDPFEEGGVVEGIKVTPSDLPYFEFLPFDLSANRFLLHGYKNYQHLLLGRIEGQHHYILGIPGTYDSQEQFMAKTFGFPCFKPIHSCKKLTGQFGYWFRCIRI